MSGLLFVFLPQVLRSSKHGNNSHDNSCFLFIYLRIFVVFPVYLALYRVTMNLIQLQSLQGGPRTLQYSQQLFAGHFTISRNNCGDLITIDPGVDGRDTLLTHL